jgi:hypothetical protein
MPGKTIELLATQTRQRLQTFTVVLFVAFHGLLLALPITFIAQLNAFVPISRGRYSDAPDPVVRTALLLTALPLLYSVTVPCWRKRLDVYALLGVPALALVLLIGAGDNRLIVALVYMAIAAIPRLILFTYDFTRRGLPPYA